MILSCLPHFSDPSSSSSPLRYQSGWIAVAAALITSAVTGVELSGWSTSCYGSLAPIPAPCFSWSAFGDRLSPFLIPSSHS